MALAAESAGLIRQEQLGFRAGEECLTQAAALIEILQRRKNAGKETYLCFLDLKKAYDMVPHKRLLYKLRTAGLGEKMTNYIEEMYRTSNMVVRVGSECSEPFKYGRGVRQGCPTSPVIFNLYINDLLEGMRPVEIPGCEQRIAGLLFADDTVLFEDTLDGLREKLRAVEDWMSINLMELNIGKCGIMHVQGGTPADRQVVLYKEEQIPWVDRYTYLGVDINNQLDLDKAAQFRVAKGQAAVRTLHRALSNKSVSTTYKSLLIRSIVIPITLYGAEIFGMSQVRIKKVRQVVDSAIAIAVGTNNFSRARAYEELELKQPQVIAAGARARALQKWQTSASVMSTLIESDRSLKTKKATWTRTASKWLKAYGDCLSISDPKAKAKAEAAEKGRMERRDKTATGRLARKYNFKAGGDIRKAEKRPGVDHVGLRTLTKMRLGTYLFADRLVALGKIPQGLRHTCLICRERKTESLEHIILGCRALETTRREYLQNTISECGGANQPTPNKTHLIKVLLGRGDGGPPERRQQRICDLSRFLAVAHRRRVINLTSVHL